MTPWWRSELLEVRENRLAAAGVEAAALAERYGTPLYVYGKRRILANLDRLEAAFRPAPPGLEVRVAYAMKANAHRGILGLLRRRSAWIDAVSPGEIETALRAGIPAGRILYTCTSVSAADLRRIFAIEGVTITIDALEQIPLMAEAAAAVRPRSPVRVAVRWNPGLGRGFNAKVVTAGARSPDGTPIKFGVEASRVLAAFRAARDAGFVPVGLHQHLGSGWDRDDLPAVKIAVDRLIGRAKEAAAAGFRLEYLDFGGGFGPRYEKGARLFPLRDYARHILARVRAADLGVQAVIVEPGKFLVGDAGILLLRVQYMKESYGHLFACVDGGTYNTVPRPAIYQARHEVVNASRVAGPNRVAVTVAGHLCETGDVFARDRRLPRPRSGDVLAVLCAGAYCRSMASRFNGRPIPREILI